MNHLQVPTPELLAPDAPERFAEVRCCEDCNTKVNSFQKRRYAKAQGSCGPLLCYLCLEKRIDGELKQLAQKATEKKQDRKRVEAAKKTNTIGPKIRSAREALGMTQVELAKKAGFDQRRISRYEQGEYRPGGEAAAILASALHMAPEELKEAA